MLTVRGISVAPLPGTSLVTVSGVGAAQATPERASIATSAVTKIIVSLAFIVMPFIPYLLCIRTALMSVLGRPCPGL
jgi:hypothetical protein